MKTAESENISFPTSCQCRVDEDGDFDLVLPNGVHIHGEGGKAAAEAAHRDWVLERMKDDRVHTKPGGGTTWLCIPLT